LGEVSTSEIATVLAWHDALNSGDVDTLIDLSSDDVELAGPRGASQGIDALRSWAQDAGVHLVAGRMFTQHGVFVVQEEAAWADGTATVASALRVVDNQVVSVFRHTDLDEALAATGLGADDEVDPA